jgi:hypothetical protein
MSHQAVTVQRGGEERAIERCIDSFVNALTASGYCDLVIQQKLAMVAQFVRWLSKRRVALGKVDEATVSAFLAHWSRRGFHVGNRRSTLAALLEHLRQPAATVRPEPMQEVLGSAQLLLRRYEAYLRLIWLAIGSCAERSRTIEGG